MDLSKADRIYEHAMLREIHEQPRVIDDILNHYLEGDALSGAAFACVRPWIRSQGEIMIAASGSSRHAGLAGEIMLEDLTGVPVDVEYASEYSYRSVHTLRNPAVIVISQSGETADTLAALREAKKRGHITLAITNAPGSTMAREADVSLPASAGIEQAIPATKSFTTQLVVLYLLALFASQERGTLDRSSIQQRVRKLRALPDLLANAMDSWEAEASGIAREFRSASTFLYLGRGVHYAIAREGALKLKESSYLYAEGYPAGELKHGPNALVSDQAPLVVLATVDESDPDSTRRYQKTLQLLRDLRTQGAMVLAVANHGDERIAQLSSHCIFVPEVMEHLLPVCEVIPLQMFAYFVAVQNGIDVDRPRNLVKAVVTE